MFLKDLNHLTYINNLAQCQGHSFTLINNIVINIIMEIRNYCRSLCGNSMMKVYFKKSYYTVVYCIWRLQIRETVERLIELSRYKVSTARPRVVPEHSKEGTTLIDNTKINL